jgi:hypothetical protein
MHWVTLAHDHSCETCGAGLQHWIRLMWNGQRTVEVTFCPVCSSELKRMVEAEVLSASGSAVS